MTFRAPLCISGALIGDGALRLMGERLVTRYYIVR